MIWPAQVLLVARESDERGRIQRTLAASGIHVFCYATLLEVQSFLSGQRVNAIFAEVQLPDGDFRDLRADVEHFQQGVPIVALTRDMGWDSYLASLASGAFDCISIGASAIEIKRVLWSALNAYSAEPRPEPVATSDVDSVLSAR